MTKEEFSKLKNGDKIICIIDIPHVSYGIPKPYPIKGVKGMVVDGDNKSELLVQLFVDNLTHPYNLFFVEHFEIERLKNKKPKDNQQEILKVIRSGKATVVIMVDDQGRYIKGVAKCCPEDEYDSIYGLSLAYERALAKKAKKKQKYLNEMFENKCG